MNRVTVTVILASAALLLGGHVRAQQAPAPAAPPAYGAPIALEQAKKVAAAAAAEAKKNNWGMAISVVNGSGDLVYFEALDGTQYASNDIAIHKARVAARYRRPTKVFEDRMAEGPVNAYLVTLDGIIGSQGGVPIIVDGKIIGAIGVSGGTGPQDNQTATAGASAFK
jgi:glc operon protein GlcG